MSVHYFLDWRPIQAMPLSLDYSAVVGQIGYAEVEPFIHRTGGHGYSMATQIPAADALNRARAVARNDGLFIFELEIDDARGIDPADIDELAYVVSVVLKQGLLKHTRHPQELRRKGQAERLRSTQILYVPPVRLAPGQWSHCLTAGELTPDQLRAAMCANGPPGKTPRHALAHLRHRYLRVVDTIGFRIAIHRKRQDSSNNFTRVLSALFYAALAAALILLPVGRAIVGLDPWAIPGLALTVVGLAVAMHFRQRIAVWDIPVMRLLRAAHGFFVSSNLINKVVEAADLDRQGRPVDDFSNVTTIVQSRLDGEQHRVALGQGWLALAVAGASLMAALAAFQTASS